MPIFAENEMIGGCAAAILAAIAQPGYSLYKAGTIAASILRRKLVKI